MTNAVPAAPRRWFVPCLAIAALTILARLPFLLYADRFFDSDEAVEGLMARHVLQGEFPALLWGQHYKGVPEIYIAAAVFLIAGSSVAALKATTLGCYIVFACVHFAAADVLFSRAVAWTATLFLIVAPPSLVFWSLSGNAEVVMTLLAGAVLVLAWHRWQSTRSPKALAVAAAAAGFALWVHQYVIYYLVALALTGLWQTPGRWRLVRRFVAAQDARPWARWVLWVFIAAGGFYALLGMVAFVTGGFEIAIEQVTISVRHAQKLWRIAGALVAVGSAVRWLAGGRVERRWLIAAVGAFLMAYAPAVAHHIRVGGSAPIARMHLDGLAAALPEIAGTVVPIVFGFKSPTTGPLETGIPAALLIAITLCLAYGGLGRRGHTRFFHMFLLSTPVLFLASGAYIDAQSYRYLMPLYAALPILYALGVEACARWHPAAGPLVLTALLLVFGSQQWAWYQRLRPDVQSDALISCAEARDVRFAYAGYWLSYKLTFLTNEALIVAPTDGVDRYPPYAAAVRAHEPVPTLRPLPEGGGPVPPCDVLVGRSSDRM